MNHQVLTNESLWQESGQTVIVPCRMMGGRGVMNHQVLTNESLWQESGQTVIVPCREQGLTCCLLLEHSASQFTLRFQTQRINHIGIR